MAGCSTESKNVLDNTQGCEPQKIQELKANETIDVDSLEMDGRNLDSSFDSYQMNQNDPSTPPDQRLPIDTAEKIFSSRKAPTFSEMFPESVPTTNEPNNFKMNKQWDASYVIEKTDLSNKISSIPFDANGKVPLMLEDTANDGFGAHDFKQPAVPSLNSDKQQKDSDNFSEFFLNLFLIFVWDIHHQRHTTYHMIHFTRSRLTLYSNMKL